MHPTKVGMVIGEEKIEIAESVWSLPPCQCDSMSRQCSSLSGFIFGAIESVVKGSPVL